MRCPPLSSRRLIDGSVLLVFLLTLAACGKNGAKTTDTAKADASGAGTAPQPSLFEGVGNPAMPTPAEPTAPAAPVDPKAVVVSVNGDAITQGQIDEALVRMFSFRGPVPPQEMPRLRQQLGERVQEQLVDQKLIEQQLAKTEFKPSDEAIAERWKVIEASLPPGTTVEEQLTRSGITREEVDAKVREMLVLESLLEPLAEGADPTEADGKAYYDANVERYRAPAKVRARHILLKTEKGFDDAKKAEMKKRLEDIRAELAKEGGPSFEDMAKQHSACPTSAKGGDLGFFTAGRMVPAFEKAAFGLEPGVVSNIVETEFGYHLIKVEEKQDATTRPYEEMKDQILNQLRVQRMDKARKAYLVELRKTAKIEPSPAK